MLGDHQNRVIGASSTRRNSSIVVGVVIAVVVVLLRICRYDGVRVYACCIGPHHSRCVENYHHRSSVLVLLFPIGLRALEPVWLGLSLRYLGYLMSSNGLAFACGPGWEA